MIVLKRDKGLYFHVKSCDAAHIQNLALRQISYNMVSMIRDWNENERFQPVLVKTTVFKLKTGFKNPSIGVA